ncbi:M48 family metallopeptidase [Neptunomonas marina]|uniref:Peptidase M48 n=1 Tax=Neptunomonas marina TaxID=1815562 RepID=A0A437QAT3_9GAMM|nr:M48 family metallopeptidase [Neptunomonas marina]RVU31682.1 peptidase M48 [Neptunomonas marina]
MIPITLKKITQFFTILAAFFILNGCQTLANVDKGLYTVADAISEKDRVTGRRSLSMASRQQQIAQGNAYIDQILKKERQAGRPINAKLDRKAYQRLVRVFDRIHQISHLRHERWQPVLIKRDSFNAFTTGGTYIVVHTGLMDQLSDDAELAAVIGHEIAHTVANHVFERQTHQTAAVLSGSSTARQNSYQAAFTHESEIEADKVGILYAALAGYDPYAASRIWARQYRKEGAARSLFFHDHPVNSERAALTRSVADKVKRYYQRGRQNPQFAQLLNSNSLWRKQQSETAAGQGGGFAALLSTALNAYGQHHAAKQEAQRQSQQMQMLRSLEKQLVVRQEKVINQRSWRVTWQNRNKHTLKNVIMGVLLKDTKGNVSRLITHIKGNIRPGQSFSGTFTLKNHKVADLRHMQLRYYLDDAKL